jgi:tRNA wybutosine-synthesizing protein 1
MPDADQAWDNPKEIMDGCIEEQRKILQGFAGNSKTSAKKFYTAMRPRHVAISLCGEPMLYPYLGDLIDDINSRKMSSFLVTNGSLPQKINALLENDQQPTQMYMTLAAPDEETLRKTSFPFFNDAWERLMKSSMLLQNFRRSVIRLTLVRNLNFHSPEKYAQIIEKSAPDFVEVKSFMAVGGAQGRLPYDSMLSQDEIDEFASIIEKNSSYKISDKQKESRVALLTRGGKKSEHLSFD